MEVVFFAEKKRIGAYVDRVDIFLIDLWISSSSFG